MRQNSEHGTYAGGTFSWARAKVGPKGSGPLASLVLLIAALLLAACGATTSPAAPSATSSAASEGPYTTVLSDFRDADVGCGWEPVGRMDLRYARCFTVDYFADDYALVCVADGSRYLVVPEGGEAPAGLAADVQVLRKPIGDVYLAASDSLCLFDAIGALDRISVSGIERDNWYLAAMRDAMDAGTVAYGGKYRAPDYELLVSRGVRLALESTMINHTPDVREKLLELGIPVLTEMSSYEGEPLGRAEWIRLYGLLCDKDDDAQTVFDEQVARVSSLDATPTGKTVAFFYLNANGSAVVRRPGDYVTKMIEQAGGTYAFADLEPSVAGSSSLTMEMERFYAGAKDADVLIYNATIDDGVATLEDLLRKNELLRDFAAVQSGNVWLCDQNMYQQMICAGDVIARMNQVFRGDAAPGDTAPGDAAPGSETDDAAFLRRLS